MVLSVLSDKGKFSLRTYLGSFINDATVVGGRGQLFCYNIIMASVIKSVTLDGVGVKKCPKLRDVVYGRALGKIYLDIASFFLGNH
jgi:hypothetical protein